jgi:hypothetical protein
LRGVFILDNDIFYLISAAALLGAIGIVAIKGEFKTGPIFPFAITLVTRKYHPRIFWSVTAIFAAVGLLLLAAYFAA